MTLLPVAAAVTWLAARRVHLHASATLLQTLSAAPELQTTTGWRRRLGRMVDPDGAAACGCTPAPKAGRSAAQEHVGLSFGWRMRYMALQARLRAPLRRPRERPRTRSCSTARWCSRERGTTRAAHAAARDGALALTAAVAVTALSGCDAPYQQFLGAIPTDEANPDAPVEVFLGIDGLSKQAFELARARGAFADYHVADLVTPFPGTSDYSWTRTLRAGALGGYELQYFDPQANAMENAASPASPSTRCEKGLADTLPRISASTSWATARPGCSTATWIRSPACARRWTRCSTPSRRAAARSLASLAYLLNVDVVGHLGGLDQAVAMLVEIDRRIRAFKADHRRPYHFTIFSDHGNAHQRSRLVDPKQILTDVGVRRGRRAHHARVHADDADGDAAGGDSPPLEAVAVVHVRVNYVAVHAAAATSPRSRRAPRATAYVDLAVARLADGDRRRPAVRHLAARGAVHLQPRRGGDHRRRSTRTLGLAAARLRRVAERRRRDRDARGSAAFEATRGGPLP